MIRDWVIVGGCARSGTTMIGNALGAAPEAIVTPEAQFFSEMLFALETGSLAPSTEALEAFVRDHWRFAIWEMPLPEGSWSAGNTKTARELASALIGHVVEAYARAHDKPGATVWIDHTPEHVTAMPLIQQTAFHHFIIHVVRDGRAIAASFQKLDWGPTNVHAAAALWITQLAQAFAVQATAESPSVMVRYEEFTSDPARSLARICESLPVTFDEAMVCSTALAVPRYTRNQHEAVGKGIEPGRAEAWKTGLSRRDIEIFESVAGELLRILDYRRMYREPRAATYLERLWSDMIKNPIQRRFQNRRKVQRFRRSQG